MKILYGMHQPDEGTIARLRATRSTSSSPTDAIAAGIGMVHQHFMLADNLTVLENIDPRCGAGDRGPCSTLGRPRDRLAECRGRYGLPRRPRRDWSTPRRSGERQRVEILKVLYRGARILILDEPTAVLVPQEVDELFATLRELTAEGVDRSSSSPTSSTRCWRSPTRSPSSAPAPPSPPSTRATVDRRSSPS